MSSRGRRYALLVLAGLILLLVGGRMLMEVWVELLWYRSLELERVFWTRWSATLAVRTGVGLILAGFVFVNLWVVSRSLGTIRVRRRYANIEIAERLPQSYLVGALLLVSVFSAWWISAAIGDPLAAVAALRRVEWGAVDPVFGRDISFYVFVLPVLSGVQAVAGVLIFWTLLVSAVAYIAMGAIRMQNGTPAMTPAVEKHFGLLLAGFLLVFAADAWLDRYTLLLDGNGVGGSFGYSDMSARLPGLVAIAVAALISAAVTAHSAWRGHRRPAGVALAFLAFTIIAGRLVAPSVVQRFSVEPNEFPREQPFIQHHIDATLDAYGLEQMSIVPLPYASAAGLADADPGRLLDVLGGVPLWDPRPLAVAFDQRQSLFRYYDFLSVHLDRYGPPGEAEQVAIAVRELIPSELPASAQTWQNLHFRYVSGQGAVVSPVARMADDGAPVYYLSDLNPPRLSASAPEGLTLEQPEVYFGENTSGYVILDRQEGPRGVPINGLARRLALAWAFQSKNLLLSDEVTRGSRVVFGRTVVERARAAAPFLHLTSDSPQPVVHRGRVVWVLDGYSTSAYFPLSPRMTFGGRAARYVRNSAKVVVDGVTGEVSVFAVAGDPILRTYSRVFPGLVQPIDRMPADLRAHLKVPAALIALRASLLGEYHLTDARGFYEKEDVWSVGTENYRSEIIGIDPTFVMLPLPGQRDPEFLTMMPFVSPGRQNMTALLVVRNDGAAYGEQRLYLLPRDELVPGPQQIEARIDQDPEIAQQLSLWRRGGSEVIRGRLIVVPVDSTLLYVEPLFLEAQSAAIPQLERVIVAHGGRVAMRPTLAEAFAAILGLADQPEEEAPTEAAGAAQPAVRPEALERARTLMERAEAELRAGDWAAFGRTWEALRAALRESGATPGQP